MNREAEVAVLTGGADRPYAFGLATALMSKGICIDLIGGNDLDCKEFHNSAAVTFLNLRGDQSTSAGPVKKLFRVLAYYGRLLKYAAASKASVFHVLWNNKFESIDRTLLMVYYKLLGKRIVLTAHNVNTRKRDATDTWWNRLTLAVQYRLADHVFVHTERMKTELLQDFQVENSAATVIPFGINNSVPNTGLTTADAKRRLGIAEHEKTILFFGTIAPYKGIEYVVAAFQQLSPQHRDYRLVIAGRPRKEAEGYWSAIHQTLTDSVDPERLVLKIEYVPDEDTELYFKAADVVVLPYTQIFQSGVLFLAYSFGLPVIVADVGSLKDDVVEGKTGYWFTAGDATDLARVIDVYFASALFANLSRCRQEIADRANANHSWDTVGAMTVDVYARLTGRVTGVTSRALR